MDPTAVWDAFGRKPAPDLPRFEWTQYNDHGPAIELLDTGPGRVVLDLGVGKGLHATHVLATGSKVVGVDFSPVQVKWARERLGDAVELHQGDALEVLARPEMEERFDSVYSRFGAHWFVDPEQLFPLLRRVLRPNGVFVFSHRETDCGCVGPNLHNVRDSQGGFNQVMRWDYPIDGWADMLRLEGFARVMARVVPPPDGADAEAMGTVLVETRRGD